MERKHSPIYGIKGKLVSALCMLLVAVTMVVSSTYAWFTLSTAPEVSGITTAVGANGALEIWLNATKEDGNTSAGNIVDLTAGYGLEQIVLLPSQLNIADGIIAQNFLKIPQFSSNGKPGEDLSEERTVAGIWQTKENVTNFFADDESTGVRAVGVASGLTDRQLAYRNAKYAASTYSNLATTTAATSLNNNGAALGGIVIKMATSDAPTFTLDEVQAFGTIITDLKKATGYIETAYKEMIVALAASRDDGSDDAYSNIKEGFASAENPLALTDFYTIGENNTINPVEVNGFSIPVERNKLLAGIAALQTTLGNIAAAEAEYDALVATAAETYTWEQISPIINFLIVKDHTKLNGESMSAGKDALIQSVLNGGVNITLEDGAGAYVEIAAHCGNYSANVTMENVSVEQMGNGTLTVTANMATNSTQSPKHLDGAQDDVKAAGEPSNDGATASSMPMTEFYGFIIDLAFKTNAANSNLLLQTDPRDRIYEDNANEATQGKGSYMTYRATTTELTADQVKGLMACIRIVFFDPDSLAIMGEARLDTANAEIGADGVTAKMYMYKDNTLQDGTQKNAEDEVTNGDTAIAALAQNTAKKVSVLVYLDGEDIENEHVAATDVTSVTGSMNLQFASDADLVPMEYGDLHTPATPTPDGE